MPSASPNDSSGSARAAAARRKLNRLLGGLLGLVLGAGVALVVVLIVANRSRLPDLTRERLETQRRVWRRHALPNYDIEVQVTGPRAATYRVRVRDNVAVSETIDGRPLDDPRTFATWSVPGMFETIERDVETVESNAERGSAVEGVHLSLYAAFDPHYGFPTRYQRIAWGNGATGVDVTWRVTEFSPQPAPPRP